MAIDMQLARDARSRPPASRLTESGNGSLHRLPGAQHRPLLVALSPLPSALALAIESLDGPPTGAPPEWVAAVAEALDRRDRAAFAPLAVSAPRDLPDCLVPLPGAPTTTPAANIERIVATPPEVLLGQIGRASRWAVATRAPRQWLTAYGCALTHACEGIKPLWESARSLLDREVERVGVAVVQGTDRRLIADLVSANGAWSVRAPVRDSPPPASLVAVPLLAGPHATLARYRGPILTHIAYPLPGALRLSERAASPELHAVLGLQKARILQWLDPPGTAGEIADMLGLVPSAVSWHVAALERGGLVERERRGRSVLVRRTARGSALIALYDMA
jgi:DNA-binding transcriptional ArsR family regulator